MYCFGGKCKIYLFKSMIQNVLHISIYIYRGNICKYIFREENNSL